MVAMISRQPAWVWLGLSLTGLAGMLIARGLQWDGIEYVGMLFLASPIIATLLTVRIDVKNDPATAGCIFGLIALFCITWLL